MRWPQKHHGQGQMANWRKHCETTKNYCQCLISYKSVQTAGGHSVSHCLFSTCKGTQALVLFSWASTSMQPKEVTDLLCEHFKKDLESRFKQFGKIIFHAQKTCCMPLKKSQNKGTTSLQAMSLFSPYLHWYCRGIHLYRPSCSPQPSVLYK